MHRRARSILRGEQGLSMILVLCIGALFVALSAALVYAASVLTANANRQLLEQEAYQLATSFSDVLEGELNNKDSSFAKFVNEQFMFSQSYGKDIYDLESQPKEFAWKPKGSQPDGGAEAITVTLRRRPDGEQHHCHRPAQPARHTGGRRPQGHGNRRFAAGHYGDSHEKRRELCLHADL